MALLEVWKRYKRQFLDHISDGFISFDRHWNVISANTKGSLLFRSDRDDLAGTNVKELAGLRESEFFKKISQAMEKQAEVTFKEYSQTLQTWLEVRAFPTEEGAYVLFRELSGYHSLFLQHPDAVYAMDLAGHYVTVNPSTEKITGYSSDELLHKHFGMNVHPADLPRALLHFETAAKGTPQRFEVRSLTKTGELVDLRVTNLPIIVDESIVGVYGIAKEITQQKEVENALRMSEKALAQSQRIARVGHWETGFATRLSKWSEETFRIFGLEPREEPVPRDLIMSFIHPDDREKVEAEIRKAQYGHPLRVEYRIMRPDGEERIVLSQREAHHEASDPAKMFGIIQDITEQKRTEQLLSESQKRYQSLMTYNSDGVTAAALDGSYLEVNPAFERMTGYSKEELLNMSFCDLLREEDVGQSVVIWNTLVREGVPFTISQQLVQKGGQLVEVTIHNIPIIVHEEVTGYFTIYRDTSQQKRTDEILRQSDKLAAVGQLAAAVAHEVRNPLTSLKGFTQLLQHQFPTADQSYFDIMKGELERIELISGELLVLAKPKPEQFEQRCVNQIVREVVTLLESQANMSAVAVELSLEPDLPLLLCDVNQLKQVFVNIMKNGIEAMKDGGKLRVETRRQEGYLFISFADEGCGIPQEKLARIGDPFFTTKETGTGLGMMITQKIVQHHKGFLQVESEQGRGTIVKVLLPLGGA